MAMDPFAADVLTGLLVNAATAVVGQAARWRTESVRRGVTPAQLVANHFDTRKLAARLNTAVASYGKLSSHKHPNLRQFLQSPEMANVARQLLAAAIVGDRRYDGAIQQELAYLLQLSV